LKRLQPQIHLSRVRIADRNELGGQRLFAYEDKTGAIYSIDSADINEYLSKSYKSQVSAKDLRTWRASVEAVDYLRKIKKPEDRESEIREAIRYAADQINNRYATCRKHYVHPKILTAYQASGTTGFSRLKIQPQSERQLSEVLLLRILQS
jgi:DNA topoisomerase-1